MKTTGTKKQQAENAAAARDEAIDLLRSAAKELDVRDYDPSKMANTLGSLDFLVRAALASLEDGQAGAYHKRKTDERRAPTVAEAKSRLGDFQSSVSRMSPAEYKAHTTASAAAEDDALSLDF